MTAVKIAEVLVRKIPPLTILTIIKFQTIFIPKKRHNTVKKRPVLI
jgi:hypothetical protein